jgi:methylenetetrahydrofolate--tRNA-(uracil-5-)-methyltransferase
MHRNTYLNSPTLLRSTLQYKDNPRLFFAGQITGVEGYMESAATGILAGINAVRLNRGQAPLVLSNDTMLGALAAFITDPTQQDFQPINANFGILPALNQPIRDKKQRYQAYVERSRLKMIEIKHILSQQL